jgi:uncharacterized alkaline shock family protein YloU
MTDPVSEIPAQPGADATKKFRAGAVADKANEAFDKAGDALHDAADRAGVVLHDAAGRAGEVVSEAAGRAGEAISEAADKAQDAIGQGVARLRNNATLPAERGTTTIANEVVEKIAGIAARDVPGVYDLGGDTARLLSAVRERIGLGNESKAQGVSVRLDGRQADLSLTLVVEYGFVVQSVCDKVREKAISAVENLLGLDVTNVDILVDDVHVDTEGPVGDDANRAAGYTGDTAGVTVG